MSANRTGRVPLNFHSKRDTTIGFHWLLMLSDGASAEEKKVSVTEPL